MSKHQPPVEQILKEANAKATELANEFPQEVAVYLRGAYFEQIRTSYYLKEQVFTLREKLVQEKLRHKQFLTVEDARECGCCRICHKLIVDSKDLVAGVGRNADGAALVENEFAHYGCVANFEAPIWGPSPVGMYRDGYLGWDGGCYVDQVRALCRGEDWKFAIITPYYKASDQGVVSYFKPTERILGGHYDAVVSNGRLVGDDLEYWKTRLRDKDAIMVASFADLLAWLKKRKGVVEVRAAPANYGSPLLNEIAQLWPKTPFLRFAILSELLYDAAPFSWRRYDKAPMGEHFDAIVTNGYTKKPEICEIWTTRLRNKDSVMVENLTELLTWL
jgi:hypothetical protein